MEWLQDQLLRIAARYYCQDVDIDASKLQVPLSNNSLRVLELQFEKEFKKC